MNNGLFGIHRRGRAALLVLVAAVGCDYFSDVTVPAVDTTAPTAYASVWRSEVYEEISFGTNDPLSFEVDDPTEYYVLIGAGTDGGGVKKLTINSEYSKSCEAWEDGDKIVSNTSGLSVPLVKTQTGGVGSTVSNGLWDGPYVRLSDYASCNSGWTLGYVALRWTVIVEDFHGNTATHGPAVFYWDP
ncbi:hypothetical protein [Nannocystis punicea]|uniref:Lipoprotein n=1 Tax=Nannocystis punicea TaxID=2995304 RepID=A0ABY7GUM8_9BACT|nr:hypothetical protein [Nannocystis poenicansa]WAS90674.1 hypothetical protein O0S08_31185 [Nannocystis poenicansa]